MSEYILIIRDSTNKVIMHSQFANCQAALIELDRTVRRYWLDCKNEMYRELCKKKKWDVAHCYDADSGAMHKIKIKPLKKGSV